MKFNMGVIDQIAKNFFKIGRQGEFFEEEEDESLHQVQEKQIDDSSNISKDKVITPI